MSHEQPISPPPGWRRRRRRRQAGHTLIEVMIASAVFSIGAMGLLSLMYRSTQGTAAAKRITQATALGTTKLDELQRTPYSQLVNGTYQEGTFNGNKNVGPAGTPFAPDGSATGAYASSDGWYFRSWTITTDSTLAFKLIVVTVQWYDGVTNRVRSASVTGGKSEL